jgi:excisionase family DNA binding protein
MEKICIAKRRAKYPPLELHRPERQSIVQPVEDDFLLAVPEDYVPKATERAMSMELTHEQAMMFRSGIDLAPGKACMIYLETKRQENGRVIFNFSLAPLYGGKMLCSKEVCSMLEVSRSFLRKMVRTGRIDSYKIGRLRRFLLEDVLHYLSSNRELIQGRM